MTNLHKELDRAVEMYRAGGVTVAECARTTGVPYHQVMIALKGLGVPRTLTNGRRPKDQPAVNVSADPRVLQLERRHREEFDQLKERQRTEMSALAEQVASEMADGEIQRVESEMAALERKMDELRRLRRSSPAPQAHKPALELVKVERPQEPDPVREFAEARGISIEAAKAFMAS